MVRRVAVSCDHGGFELKRSIVDFLKKSSIEVVDMGVHSSDPVDYPDRAHVLTEAIISGQVDRGILICGTGIGISIAANRRPGIRAALCTDSYMAKMSREHNDANVLCLGGRIIGPALAEDIVFAFLISEFQGGRHVRRIEKIEIK